MFYAHAYRREVLKKDDGPKRNGDKEGGYGKKFTKRKSAQKGGRSDKEPSE